MSDLPTACARNWHLRSDLSGRRDSLAVAETLQAVDGVAMGAYVWLLVIVFLVTLVYPPAGAGLGCLALTAGVVVWLLRKIDRNG